MKAFEHADVEGLKRLLTEDVLMEMPPMLNWFAGREQLRPVHGLGLRGGREGLASQGGHGQRGQPGFAAYRRVGDGYELHTLQIFTVTAEGISRNRCSRTRGLRGLGGRLDAQGLANVGFCLPPAR